MAQYLLTAVIAVLGTVLSVLLTLILGRLTRLENKLDGKRDTVECVRQQVTCGKLFAFPADFWEQFGKHSHTGLPAGSKVTR